MSKIFFIIPVVFLSCFYLSCDNENTITKSTEEVQYSKADYSVQLGTFAGLDEETEWQIVQAYYQKIKNRNVQPTINDVKVEQYYGSYCPVYLFPEYGTDLLAFLRTGYLEPKNQTVTVVKVSVKGIDYGTAPGDVIINIPNSGWPSVVRFYDKSSFVLYNKGNLYDMEKDAGNLNQLLTAWDARKIINRYNGLDFETDAKIREDIGKFILTDWTTEDYAQINMTYLGTYNGYTAITLLNYPSATAVYRKIIYGVGFYFPYTPIHIFAWKEGKIYELDDLFEQGLITHENLIEMAYFHHAGKEY